MRLLPRPSTPSVVPTGAGRRASRPRAVALAASCFGALAVGVVAAPAASAQDPSWLLDDPSCDVAVVGDVGTGDFAGAQRAAEVLGEDLRVFPRARAYVEVDGPVPTEEAAEAWLAQCPSWQAGDGFARTDLLLLVIDVDGRVVDTFLGEDLVDELDPYVNTAHDRMRPALVDGRWGDALELGLVAYGERLGVDMDPSEPVAGWVVPAAAAGGVAVVGGGAWAVVGGRRRRKRKGVQAQAEAAKTRAMSQWFDLESRWETIQAGVTVMTQAVHEDDGVSATVQQEADEAERALTEVRDELLAGPDPTTVTDQAGADAAVAEWTRLEERVATATVEVDEVEAAVEELTTARQEAPGRVSHADSVVRQADEAIAIARGTALPDSQVTYVAAAAHGLADDARKAAAAARTALDGNRFGDAVVAANTAVARAEEAMARCAELPTLAAELPARARTVAEQARDAVTAAASSKNALTTLRSKFRRTVWDDISDAPDRAHDLAEEAAELAAEAAEAAHEREQDWDGAATLLDRAEALLAESAALAAAPRARDLDATTQLDAATTRYAAVRAKVAEAEAMLTATAADVSAHASAVRAATRQLAKGEELLTGKPDPIRAAAIADEVEGIVERATGGARGIIDAHRRDLQRAEQALRQGRAELERADRERPRSRRWSADLRRADTLLDDAAAQVEQRPGVAADQAQKALDLARRIIREKRRDRDGDRDQWRAPRRRGSSAGDILGSVLTGGIGGGVSRSSGSRSSGTRSSGRSVLGGSPTRPAPRSSAPRSSGGSRRGGRGSFGGGGSNKF